jgi:Tfp pilus assembly protein PilO
MLIVFGLIAVLFVIGYLVVKHDQKNAAKDTDAKLLKQECEDREFARRSAAAASLAALQKQADDIREARAAKIAEAGLVPAVPVVTERRKQTEPKKKAKKGRSR